MSRALSGFERGGARRRYQSRELVGGVIFDIRTKENTARYLLIKYESESVRR